jgi:superfamily II DNA or RNA helicase
MRLVTNNNFTVLSDVSSRILFELDSKFAVSAPGHFFSQKFRAGLWDGRIHFARRYGATIRFATGLLSEVSQILKTEFPDVWARGVIEDKRIIPDWKTILSRIQPQMLHKRVLRDYQIRSAREAVKNLRGILALATNAGKTEVASVILKAVNLPSLYLCSGKDVMFQTQKSLQSLLGEKIGIVGSGKRDIQKFTVGLAQTLSKTHQFPFLNSIQLFVADECHHLKSNTWLEVLNACPNAVFRFGLSGTPYADELAERRLTGATGSVISEVSNQFLVEQGISAKPKFIFQKVCPAGVETLSYKEAYRDAIVLNDERNQFVIDYCKKFQGRSILVLVWQVVHGKVLEQIFKSQGMKAQFVSGQDAVQDRIQAVGQFRRQSKSVLIASTIFDEGISIPEIDVLILAAGWKTPLRFLQRVGRAMRTRPDKKSVVIIDFLDFGNYHTLLHSKARLEAAKGEGFEIIVQE